VREEFDKKKREKKGISHTRTHEMKEKERGREIEKKGEIK